MRSGLTGEAAELVVDGYLDRAERRGVETARIVSRDGVAVGVQCPSRRVRELHPDILELERGNSARRDDNAHQSSNNDALENPQHVHLILIPASWSASWRWNPTHPTRTTSPAP